VTVSRPMTIVVKVHLCVCVCCSVLQRVAARCSALQRVAACCSVLQRSLSHSLTAVVISDLYLCVLQCVFAAACCSMLKCVAMIYESWLDSYGQICFFVCVYACAYVCRCVCVCACVYMVSHV